MARPRKADARDHQINLRFTAPEIAKIHRHAAITGRTVTEFGRAVLLRRPRRRRDAVQPLLIALPDGVLEQWHALGSRLNVMAHIMNAHDELPPSELFGLLAQLRGLCKRSFAVLRDADLVPAYTLAPAVRHHLRKVGVNLAQIAKRFDQLGLETPLILVRLLQRIRTLMNGEQPPHGA